LLTFVWTCSAELHLYTIHGKIRCPTKESVTANIVMLEDKKYAGSYTTIKSQSVGFSYSGTFNITGALNVRRQGANLTLSVLHNCLENRQNAKPRFHVPRADAVYSGEIFLHTNHFKFEK
ncbi:hypothetical protein PMAYCL1PPCAC_32553, partial [Pristionchus mayeri]